MSGRSARSSTRAQSQVSAAISAATTVKKEKPVKAREDKEAAAAAASGTTAAVPAKKEKLFSAGADEAAEKKRRGRSAGTAADDDDNDESSSASYPEDGNVGSANDTTASTNGNYEEDKSNGNSTQNAPFASPSGNRARRPATGGSPTTPSSHALSAATAAASSHAAAAAAAVTSKDSSKKFTSQPPTASTTTTAATDKAPYSSTSASEKDRDQPNEKKAEPVYSKLTGTPTNSSSSSISPWGPSRSKPASSPSGTASSSSAYKSSSKSSPRDEEPGAAVEDTTPIGLGLFGNSSKKSSSNSASQSLETQMQQFYQQQLLTQLIQQQQLEQFLQQAILSQAAAAHATQQQQQQQQQALPALEQKEEKAEQPGESLSLSASASPNTSLPTSPQPGGSTANGSSTASTISTSNSNAASNPIASVFPSSLPHLIVELDEGELKDDSYAKYWSESAQAHAALSGAAKGSRPNSPSLAHLAAPLQHNASVNGVSPCKISVVNPLYDPLERLRMTSPLNSNFAHVSPPNKLKPIPELIESMDVDEPGSAVKPKKRKYGKDELVGSAKKRGKDSSSSEGVLIDASDSIVAMDVSERELSWAEEEEQKWEWSKNEMQDWQATVSASVPTSEEESEATSLVANTAFEKNSQRSREISPGAPRIDDSKSLAAVVASSDSDDIPLIQFIQQQPPPLPAPPKEQVVEDAILHPTICVNGTEYVYSDKLQVVPRASEEHDDLAAPTCSLPPSPAPSLPDTPLITPPVSSAASPADGGEKRERANHLSHLLKVDPNTPRGRRNTPSVYALSPQPASQTSAANSTSTASAAILAASNTAASPTVTRRGPDSDLGFGGVVSDGGPRSTRRGTVIAPPIDIPAASTPRLTRGGSTPQVTTPASSAPRTTRGGLNSPYSGSFSRSPTGANALPEPVSDAESALLKEEARLLKRKGHLTSQESHRLKQLQTRKRPSPFSSLPSPASSPTTRATRSQSPDSAAAAASARRSRPGKSPTSTPIPEGDDATVDTPRRTRSGLASPAPAEVPLPITALAATPTRSSRSQLDLSNFLMTSKDWPDRYQKKSSSSKVANSAANAALASTHSDEEGESETEDSNEPAEVPTESTTKETPVNVQASPTASSRIQSPVATSNSSAAPGSNKRKNRAPSPVSVSNDSNADEDLTPIHASLSKAHALVGKNRRMAEAQQRQQQQQQLAAQVQLAYLLSNQQQLAMEADIDSIPLAAISADMASAAAAAASAAAEAADDSEPGRPSSKKQKLSSTKSPVITAKSDAPYGNIDRFFSRAASIRWQDQRLHFIQPSWIQNKSVLDLGCNSGLISILLASSKEFSPKKVVGVDIDQNLIQMAKEMMQQRLTGSSAPVASPTSAKPRIGSIAALSSPAGGAFSTAPVSSLSRFASGSSSLSASSSSTKPALLSSFPSNLQFDCSDVLSSSYSFPTGLDVICCFSLTKWIHFHRGDQGIKDLFTKIHKALPKGGMLILEPQPWRIYKKKATLTPEIKETVKKIQLKPEEFPTYLQSHGFLLKHTFHPQEMPMEEQDTEGEQGLSSFSSAAAAGLNVRPIYIFEKK